MDLFLDRGGGSRITEVEGRLGRKLPLESLKRFEMLPLCPIIVGNSLSPIYDSGSVIVQHFIDGVDFVPVFMFYFFHLKVQMFSE
jgi:hypothetical protein